jgi:hypothetical protein
VPEQQMAATRMNSDFIELTVGLWMLIKKITRRAFALCGRAAGVPQN